MDDKGPADPMTSLGEGAAQLHEIYTSYLVAGFNPAQALYLVGKIVAAAVASQSGPSGA